MLKTSLPPDNSAALEQAIAAVAAAMADPSRVKMLCALMDGRAWTATELSAAADVAPSTASGHLARLLDGKLITCLSQGRHRYYRLAGHDVAELVEQMMGLSWHRISPPETSAPKALREARTCYDHLAGAVAGARRFGTDPLWPGAVPETRYSVKHASPPKGLLRLSGLERAAVSSGRRSWCGAAHASGKQGLDPAGSGVSGGGAYGFGEGGHYPTF